MSRDYNVPDTWVKTSIEEIILYQKGKKPKKLEPVEFEGSVPYLDIKAFEKKEIRQFADKQSSQIIDINDLVMVWDGARSGWVAKGMDGALGSTIARFRPFIIPQKYLFYFLSSQFSYLNTNAKGTGIPHVDPQILWGIKMPLPPHKEQHRIVSKIEELFSDLDNGVANLRKSQNQLKAYRQALLKYAFEGKLTEQWRKENNPEPAEKLLERIKIERQQRYEQELKDWKVAVKSWEKNGKKGKKPSGPKPIIETEISFIIPENIKTNIPSNWIWAKNKYLAYKITDGEHVTPVRTEAGYYLLSARNIQNGYLDFSDVDYVGKEEYERIRKRCNPEFGDILISCSGTIGRVSHVPQKSDFVMVRSVALIKYSTNLLNYKYLEYLFQSPELQAQIDKGKKATAQANLFLGPISEFYLPICSTEEQIEIVSQLEVQFSIIDNLEKTIKSSLEKSEALRQSILKQAFEGKLVEQDSKDEPANELLKRIKAEKKKYLEEQKHQKKSGPKKIKNMNKNLIEIIENKFESKRFSYEELKSEVNLPYDDLKKQLFDLLENGEKLKSTFDSSHKIIKYQLMK